VKKSERTFRHFLEDMFESISKILIYTKSYDFDMFRDDERTVDAVIRNLEIIGEASNKIPKNIRDKYPNFP
jgi:uncharacterized protein with HEPN domain